MGVLFRNIHSGNAREIYGDEIKVFEAKPNWQRVSSISLESQDAKLTEERIEQLSKINGVGKSTANKLINAGYICLKDIAESAAKELAEKLDIPEEKAGYFKAEAEELIENGN